MNDCPRTLLSLPLELRLTIFQFVANDFALSLIEPGHHDTGVAPIVGPHDNTSLGALSMCRVNHQVHREYTPIIRATVHGRPLTLYIKAGPFDHDSAGSPMALEGHLAACVRIVLSPYGSEGSYNTLRFLSNVKVIGTCKDLRLGEAVLRSLPKHDLTAFREGLQSFLQGSSVFKRKLLSVTSYYALAAKPVKTKGVWVQLRIVADVVCNPAGGTATSDAAPRKIRQAVWIRGVFGRFGWMWCYATLLDAGAEGSAGDTFYNPPLEQPGRRQRLDEIVQRWPASGSPRQHAVKVKTWKL